MSRNIAKLNLLPWALLFLSALVLAALGVKYRTLRQDFLEHRRADTRLQRGAYVPLFAGVSATGDSLVVGQPPAGRQVLIFLTSTCPFCRETLPFWKQMARLSQSSSWSREHVPILALTTDSMTVARAYATRNELPFPLVPFPSRKFASMYRGFTVPQTIVVDAEGRVLLARHGVINMTQAVDSIMAVLTGAERLGNTETQKLPPTQSSNFGQVSAVPGGRL